MHLRRLIVLRKFVTCQIKRCEDLRVLRSEFQGMQFIFYCYFISFKIFLLFPFFLIAFDFFNFILLFVKLTLDLRRLIVSRGP